jgi:hypothetical protein
MPIVDALWKLALIPLAVAGVLYLVRLSGFKLTQQQTLELKQAVETSMLAIEAEGLKAWKDHSARIPGPEKLDLAVRRARELSKDGLQNYSDAELATYTEAALVLARPLISTPPPPSSSLIPPPSFSVPPSTKLRSSIPPYEGPPER